ncbi:hypothetical protein PoB_000855300 [Plakobranchus ocellatus]|uniref:Uncharacterized protein n=1 Tax=Plakobranchus ocellatus TaxID=259542 RepID=A0AAV3YI04_9GAST|nr:hypothetical protein PoB_000855300 [Plakobranchus ocellatus]
MTVLELLQEVIEIDLEEYHTPLHSAQMIIGFLGANNMNPVVWFSVWRAVMKEKFPQKGGIAIPDDIESEREFYGDVAAYRRLVQEQDEKIMFNAEPLEYNGELTSDVSDTEQAEKIGKSLANHIKRKQSKAYKRTRPTTLELSKAKCKLDFDTVYTVDSSPEQEIAGPLTSRQSSITEQQEEKTE